MKYFVILLIFVGFAILAPHAFGICDSLPCDNSPIQSEEKYQFIDFSYANTIGEPIQFILEKTRDRNCNSYNAKITDDDGNFILGWGAEISCDPVIVSSPVQTKIGYGENKPIIINESGKYYLEVEFIDTFIKQEFTVRQNHGGGTLDRTDYSIPFDMPSPHKQMELGIKLGHIICDKDKSPVWNTHYKPACVFSDTESELIKRGWAKLRLLLPAGPDPVKEMDWMGRNVMSMMLEGTFSYSSTPVETLDEKRNAVEEYSKQYHQGEKYLEYAIIPYQYHYDVGDKVYFELLEWGIYSDCRDLKLRIIDMYEQSVFENSLDKLCIDHDGTSVTFNSYSMGDNFEEFVCDNPGYYRIEVTNGDIFSPTILQNFACLESESMHEPEKTSSPEPEPGPIPESDSLQRQKQQQTKLHTQEIIISDTRGHENKINAIKEYRDGFESGYFLEQFIILNKQNYEKGELINFVYGEWGYQPKENTSPKVDVYFRSYDDYDKIEKINEWQKPKDQDVFAISPDSDGYLMMDLWGMSPATGTHETCTIPGEYRVAASNPDDKSKVEWGYFTCQKEKLVGESQPWMELPE